MLSQKCPLCNQPTSSHHPAFKKVYFSITDGSDNDNKAIMAAKAEREAAKAEITTLHKEYDDLAIELTVVRDKINKVNDEKTRVEKDFDSLTKQNAGKDKKIKKLTQDLQASRLKIKEENDKMTLKLIAKHKSVDLLAKNLETSNNKIKSLKEEIVAYQRSNNEDNHSTSSKRCRPREQNYDSKYADLNKEHKALKEKMFQLEKKFIDLTLSTSVSLPPPLPKPELDLIRFQQLEEQLATSKAKEIKLLKEAMKFKQIKQEATEENLQLQEKLNNSEIVIGTLIDNVMKDTQELMHT